MSHVKLGLQAVNKGAQHIPDAAFENIPYFGPRYFKESDKNNRRRNRDKGKQSDSSSDTSGEIRDESEAERGARSSRRRSNRSNKTRGRRSSDADRGYDSDRGPRGYGDSPYFPPPPTQPENQQAYVPKPYNPREYGENPGTRDQYYTGHPLEQQPYIPPPPPTQPANQPAGEGRSKSAHFDHRRSSIADRYRPANYPPSQHLDPNRATSRGASPYPTQALAVRRHSNQDNEPVGQYYGYPGNTYAPPDLRDDDEYYNSQRNRSRSSGRRSRRDYSPKERPEEMSDRVLDELKRHKKDIGSVAIGALAGSIIGNQFAKKDSKMGLLLGAAIGGIGGGLIERKHENDKLRRSERRGNSRVKMDRRDGYESH